MSHIVMRGVCCLYNEEELDGGYWAFQDVRFMGVPRDRIFVCRLCYRYWNRGASSRVPERFFDWECTSPDAHDWVKKYPTGVWLDEGLHPLFDGDVLSIFTDRTFRTSLYRGEISMQWREKEPFQVDGRRVQPLPRGVSITAWKSWFLEEYPAQLTLGPHSRDVWEKWRKHDCDRKLREIGRA